MRTPAHAIVIGSGVIGLACAIELQRRGIATTIVSPDDRWRGASWGNAGHLAVEQVEPLPSPATLRGLPRRLFILGGPVALPPGAMRDWLPFAARLVRASTPTRFVRGRAALSAALEEALPAWRRLLTHADAAALLREDGHFVVWESDATAAAGRARWKSADIGTTRIEDASSDELQSIARIVRAPLAGAIRFAGSGQFSDLGLLERSLWAHFGALGGQRHRARAMTITGNGCALVKLDEGAPLTADLAVVAAGAASASFLRRLGVKIPLIAERGYHIESDANRWPADMPPVVFEDRSMIVTRFNHGLRAAGFVEFASPGHPPDARKWARLSAHLEALGISFGEPVRRWMGARPTLPDYLPAIGRLAHMPRIAYAFGHQHLGLTLAAATGEALGALVSEDNCAIDLAPFDIRRFA